MKRTFSGLVMIMVIIFGTGCSGMRHSVSVSVEAPILKEYTGGERTSLKVSYELTPDHPVPKP